METLTEDTEPGTMEVETANTAPEDQADASNQVGNDLLADASMEATDVPDTSNVTEHSHENMPFKNHQILNLEEVSNPEIPSGQNIDQALEQLSKEIAGKTESWLLNLIDGSPSKRVLLSTIPGLFHQQFGTDIDINETFQLLGYNALRGFLESFPSMTVQALSTPLSKIMYVYRAAELHDDDTYEGDGRLLYSREDHLKKRKAQRSDSPVIFKKNKVALEETTCLRGVMEMESALTAASSNGASPYVRKEDDTQGPVSRVSSASESPEGFDFVMDRQGHSDAIVKAQTEPTTGTHHSLTTRQAQVSSTNEVKEGNLQASITASVNDKSSNPTARGDTIDLTLDSDTEELYAPLVSHPLAQSTSGVELWNITARISTRKGKAPNLSKANAAAVACLRIISGSARRWPSTGTEWKLFLQGTTSNDSFKPSKEITSEPALITWLQNRMRKCNAKTVRASLKNELVDMGCIASKKGNEIKWNRKAVKEVLALNGVVANSSVGTTHSDMEESGPGQMMIQSTSGIESKNADGSPLPFQNTRSRLRAKSPRKVTDHDAVVACLRVLRGLKRPWPSKKSEWKVFVLGYATSNNDFRPSSEVRKEPDLVEWLCEKMKATTNPGKNACSRLRAKLFEFGYISSMKGNRIVWQQAKVQQTLACSKPHQDPNCVVDTTQMDQGLVGARTDDHIIKVNEDLVAPTNHAIATQNSVVTGIVDASRICFDVANEFKLTSYELMQEQRPGDIMQSAQLEVSNDTDTLIKLLPEDLATALLERAQDISDIVLDIGRRPFAWVTGKRLILGGENRLIEANEISTIVKKLGGFGTDNRAGIERQLHRISAIRNRNSDIIGLTMRVGRHVSGNTTIVSDLLFAYPTKSILFLGEPGSGKTTVVREVSRLLSEDSNVCIVDTSNEIAGDGDTPHPCVGFARRLMVPSLDKQSSVMIECVQNHTPEVMIIDEIGRSTEVDAAQTCKNRGVRLVASAHGDLRKLLKNPKLRGLIGGVQTVLLGDAMAARQAKISGGDIQKVKAERAGQPTFDMIVELSRGLHHEWKVVMNTAEAVDSILQGKQYVFQKRVRDPVTGAIRMEIGKS